MVAINVKSVWCVIYTSDILILKKHRHKFRMKPKSLIDYIFSTTANG